MQLCLSGVVMYHKGFPCENLPFLNTLQDLDLSLFCSQQPSFSFSSARGWSLSISHWYYWNPRSSLTQQTSALQYMHVKQAHKHQWKPCFYLEPRKELKVRCLWELFPLLLKHYWVMKKWMCKDLCCTFWVLHTALWTMQQSSNNTAIRWA